MTLSWTLWNPLTEKTHFATRIKFLSLSLPFVAAIKRRKPRRFIIRNKRMVASRNVTVWTEVRSRKSRPFLRATSWISVSWWRQSFPRQVAIELPHKRPRMTKLLPITRDYWNLPVIFIHSAPSWKKSPMLYRK